MTNEEEPIAVGQLTTDQRTADAILRIDPGFVNFRKIETLLGLEGVQAINREIERIPPLPDHLQALRLAHLYTQTMIIFCQAVGVRPLSVLLSERRGRMFCSTEDLAPCPEVYDKERVISRIITPGFEAAAELHYSTEHISASTTRLELSEGGPIAVIAEQHGLRDGVITFHPLVMGAPWLESEDELLGDEAVWFSWSFFENFVDDIDEFSKVVHQPTPADISIMETISERAFKQCLAEILGETAAKDWGGEQSDHYSAHLHLKGRRMTAAFLLKGPARFAPMTLNHLGKNNDQIYRLAMEPAEMLVVQHCHDILPAVRGTLRAFAVQPGGSRRYCLIDGKDSLRLLRAYDKVDRAVELSKRP